MSKETRSQIDAYITQAPAFAQPILRHVRQLVHESSPEIEEALKWGHPSFLLRGRIVCGISAFKEHCRFGFWNSEVSARIQRELNRSDETGGQFGRLASLDDLPGNEKLRGYFAEAVKLGESGEAGRKRVTTTVRKPETVVPDDLAARLRQNEAARAAFEGFSPSHRREYIEWITEAKREETRARRLDTTIAWLAEGKPRNWKYQAC